MRGTPKKHSLKKGRAVLIASLFVLLVSSFGLYYFIFAPELVWFHKLQQMFITNPSVTEAVVTDLPIIEATSSSPTCLYCHYRWLDGLSVESEDLAQSFPVAVMIDNDVLARPQAGLSQASLVYEAPVEGGMTRYLVIFPADTDISEVGPVRSARPYFVTWAEELKALFVHCGGSPEALDKVKRSSSLYDLNEFYNSSYFWRENSKLRQAPHNILISADNWHSYLEKRGLGEKQAESWLFKEEVTPATEAKDISIYFSASFRALWRYEIETNSYQRFFNGLESSDALGKVKAKNIIIHYVESEVLDEAGRLGIDLMGEGRADICLDGVCQAGNWRKSANKRTRYYYEDGDEIKLNPGVTWIEVANTNTSVDY